MFRKVFLTSTMPETAVVSPRTLPDVSQKIEAYQREKKAYKKAAPELRPQPLEKYDARGVTDALHTDERDEEVHNAGRGRGAGGDDDDEAEMGENLDDSVALRDRYGQMITALPQYIQKKAWRLLPYILDKDIGDLQIAHVLYDLTSRARVLRSKNLGTLAALYRQLNTDVTIPKNYYVQKHLPKPARQSLAAHTPWQSGLRSRPGARNAPQVAAVSRTYPATPTYHSKASTIGTTAAGEDFSSSFHTMFSDPNFAGPESATTLPALQTTATAVSAAAAATAGSSAGLLPGATPPPKLTSTPRPMTATEKNRLLRQKKKEHRRSHKLDAPYTPVPSKKSLNEEMDTGGEWM